jgi:hypothetical protein
MCHGPESDPGCTHARNVKTFHLSLLCVLATACFAQAASPTLSISRVAPASLQFSWSSNFLDWQLISATNLSSGTWQAITQAPLPIGDALVVSFPFTNRSAFFRLQQTNSGGGCIFQATPPVITAGASSTLTWCPVAGFTYRISPGPGIITGDNLIVSPTVTTVYTLTASNATGVVTNFTPVIVNPCGFANATNWNATLTFAYNQTASAPGFNFSVARSAVSVTFHLTPFGSGIFAFDGNASGAVSINDQEDDSSSGALVTTKVNGTGPPMPQISTFTLGINCASGTYNFAAIVAVNATQTTISQGFTDSFPTTSIAGQVAIFPRALPTGNSSISGSATILTIGPFTVPMGDYFIPNDVVANDMWLNGAVTDATAVPASVSWSITPAP